MTVKPDDDEMTDAEFDALVSETEQMFREDPEFRAYVLRVWDNADSHSDGWFTD